MEMYDKKNGNVVFREDIHKYWDLTNPDAKFISVTTLIDRFTQPFDKDFWSIYKALEKFVPKEDWKSLSYELRKSHKISDNIYDKYDFTKDDIIAKQQDILDEWQKANEESCARGTKIHSELEHSFYKQGNNCKLDKFGIGGKFICKEGNTELNLENGIYPEYLISRISKDGVLRLAGQIDVLVKQGETYHIIDHKGLPLDTPILTNKGWSTMEKLNIGDRVFDKDGNLCTITVKSNIHYNPCYKIRFDNGKYIIADIDHRWLISFLQEDGSYKESVMTTLQLKRYLSSLPIKDKYNIPRILNAKPLNTEKKNLPIEPYMFGKWLMDNLEGVDISSDLKVLGITDTKFIPDDYILSSYEDRLELLKGIMDSCGDIGYSGYVINTYIYLAHEIEKLLASLGCKSTIKNGGHEYSTIIFTTDQFNPFKTEDNQVFNNDDYTTIKYIKEVDVVPTQCISVDSPSNTYLCGYSLLVTHNTNSKIEKKSYFDSSTNSFSTMKYPLNNIQDSNYWHYTLQLSTYAWMVQQLDPNAKIGELILNWYPHEGGNVQFKLQYLKKEVIRMLAYYKKQLLHERSEQKYKEIEY